MSSYAWGPELLDGLDLLEEERIRGAIQEVRRISDWHPSTPDTWDQRIRAARTAITTLDSTRFAQMPNHSIDRAFVISSLQRLAYHEADSTGVADIAEWCMNQWLSLLQRNAEDLSALRGKDTGLPILQSSTYIRVGLGQAWLARSQNVLARIHRTEGSSSSGSSGRPRSLSDRFSYTSAEEARDAERAAVEADTRAHTADYVEARGILIPAVDYFTRAVNVAERDGRLSGELLSEVRIHLSQHHACP